MDLGPSSVVALSSLERASRPLDAGFINGDYFKTKQSKHDFHKDYIEKCRLIQAVVKQSRSQSLFICQEFDDEI